MTAGELARSIRPGGALHGRLKRTMAKVRNEATANVYAETRGRWPRWSGNSEKNFVPWAGQPIRRIVFPPGARPLFRIGTPKGIDEADRRKALQTYATARDPRIPVGFSHSGPEARVIEFGLYPNPPKRGSYLPGLGYVILSENGYSKQAPGGAIRLAIQAEAARRRAQSKRHRLEP